MLRLNGRGVSGISHDRTQLRAVASNCSVTRATVIKNWTALGVFWWQLLSLEAEETAGFSNCNMNNKITQVNWNHANNNYKWLFKSVFQAKFAVNNALACVNRTPDWFRPILLLGSSSAPKSWSQHLSLIVGCYNWAWCFSSSPQYASQSSQEASTCLEKATGAVCQHRG